MKNIFKLLLVCLAFTACDSVDSVKYNSSEADGPTFLSFSRTSYTLPIERDGVGELNIVLNSSTVADFDRTYNLIIDEEASSADPTTYSIPSTITIPAGSFQGIAVVTGQDLGIVESSPLPVVLTLGGLTDEDFDSNSTTINVREVCAVTAPFVGNYTVTQVTTPIPVNGGLTVFENGSVVAISVPTGGNTFDRTFNANIYPGVGGGTAFDFNFSLICGETVLSNSIDFGVGCTDVTLQFQPAEGTNSSYDPEDDSVFEVTITEDAANSCNSKTQTTIRFTKVQ